MKPILSAATASAVRVKTMTPRYKRKLAATAKAASVNPSKRQPIPVKSKRKVVFGEGLVRAASTSAARKRPFGGEDDAQPISKELGKELNSILNGLDNDIQNLDMQSLGKPETVEDVESMGMEFDTIWQDALILSLVADGLTAKPGELEKIAARGMKSSMWRAKNLLAKNKAAAKKK